MSKVIGIDLGTTNSCPVRCRFFQKRRTSGRPAGKTPGCFQPGQNHQLH